MTSIPGGLRPGHTPGLSERQVAASSGLSQKQIAAVSSGGLTNKTLATCVLYTQPITIPSADWVAITPSTVSGGGQWIESRLPYAATPCFTLIIATAGIYELQLRITGRDGFGQPLTTTSPILTISAATNLETHRIWAGMCFSRIDKIEYRWPQTVGTVASISCGLFFTWDPALHESIWQYDAGTFYVHRFLFNLNQGIHCGMELVGARDTPAAPNVYPEVLGCYIHSASPGPTTIANVKPRTSGSGYVLTASDPDINNFDPYLTTYRFTTWEQDPNKIRLNAVPGVYDILALDGVTAVPLYAPATNWSDPTFGTPVNPHTIFYSFRVGVGKLSGQRMSSPLPAF